MSKSSDLFKEPLIAQKPVKNVSQQIKELICVHQNNRDFKYILNDFSINWDQLKHILTSTENLDDSSECLRLKRIIDPIIFECHEIVLSRQGEFINTLETYSKWTNLVSEIEEILKNFCVHPEKYALTGVLRLTALLEFALSNVYKTYNKRQAPHLLKDLLKELNGCTYFKSNQIFILQILLGTSKGSNIRNLAWHGFLEFLNPSYISFLFVIIISYGKQLQNIPIEQKFRNILKFTIKVDIQSDLLYNLLQSKTIQNCNLETWKLIYKFQIENDFVSGIYLLLSQIEHLLRSIYGQVNSIDVTADINKYYVIMDSIFYDYVLSSDITPLVIGKITKCQEQEIRKTHQRNKLLDFFPRSIFYMYHDLFFAVDGPRIRDKISHGEVVVGENSEEIFLTLVRFTSLVVEYYEHKNIYCDYQSIYHSNLIFYKKLEETSLLIENVFKSLNIPKALNGDCSIESEKVTINFGTKQIEIHFRPFIESQLVKMMLKILDTFSISITLFQESCNELFQQYEARKLSSSRRSMLMKLITFLPNFSRGFNALLNFLLKTFTKVQKLDDKSSISDNWSAKIIKMLKQTLQLTQVYQKHFSSNDRNYFVANSRTCEFLLQIVDNNQHMFKEE